MSSKVYVVQRQTVPTADGGSRSLFDFSLAGTFGQLVFLLGNEHSHEKPREAVAALQQGLQYFTPEDHLLLVGNPCLIGWATAVAAYRTDGRVSMLIYRKATRQYEVVESPLQLFAAPFHTHEVEVDTHLMDVHTRESRSAHLEVTQCWPDGGELEMSNESFFVDGETHYDHRDMCYHFGVDAVQRLYNQAATRWERCDEC